MVVGDLSFDRRSTPCDEEQIESYDALRRCLGALFSTNNVKSSPEDIEKDSAPAMTLNCHLETLWQGRRMFVTAKDRIRFGSGPVKPRDIFSVLYSGPTTFVLRRNPDRDTYTFFHRPYTHGLMRGEAFDLLNLGEAAKECFAIE